MKDKFSDSPSSGISPKNSFEYSKKEITASAREAISFEKIGTRLANAAFKLQLEVEGNSKLKSKVQKERRGISIEREKESYFVTSFGEKTEIKPTLLDKGSKHFGLKIEGKDGIVYSIGHDYVSKVGDKITMYKGYDDEDVLVLVGIANIINAALYYAKIEKNIPDNPFDSHGTVNMGNMLTASSTYDIKGINIPALPKDIISQVSIINFLKRHSDGSYEKSAEPSLNNKSSNILNNMTKYLNRRYFDEKMTKEANSK